VSDQKKPKVIFLCTGNSARSQMAEGLMRHLGGESYEVYSAGLEPKGINPFAIRAMDEIGIDIRDQASTDVMEYLGRVEFPYLITLCDHAEANCPRAFLSLGEHEHWGLQDPAAFAGSEDEKLAVFIEARNDIEGRIREWLAAHGHAST
jgi:arsenate reductase